MAREHVHLIGIGGTGMAALAGLFHERGARVTGSDLKLYPPTSTILAGMGVTVFDPWFKPEVRGIQQYGPEDETTTAARQQWTFEPGEKGARQRAECAETFWPALHIDLRMVDTSDFVIAYCPTNIYSVGTPHESFSIIRACRLRCGRRSPPG